MTLEARLQTLITDLGTDWKNIWTALADRQPLDSDLTAIAALATTSYGRAFLALADQTAFMALVQAASETVAGKLEIATQAETNTGTDDARAITPLKFTTRLTAAIAATAISNLEDVDDSGRSDLDILYFDNGSQQWKPISTNWSAPSSYGIGLIAAADDVDARGLLAAEALGSAAAAQAASQPLDSDLTAIAALSTTSYGRALLALADGPALTALLSAASETVSGRVELATTAEINTGTDDVRAVTPLKFQTLNSIEPMVFSKGGVLAVGAGTFRLPIKGGTFEIDSVAAMVGTAPTGGTQLAVDVNKNGTTIYGTQGNRPIWTASANAATVSTHSVTSVTTGDYLTIDIDAVGSTIAGSDLVVVIRLRRTA